MAFHVVMVEHQIDVDQREQDEEPGREVVPEVQPGVAAEERRHPGEQVREPRVAHVGIHREAARHLEQEDEEHHEVREVGQGVVADRDKWPVGRLEDVHLEDGYDLAELREPQRQEVLPVGVLVADEAPVDAEREVEDEDVGRHEVNEPGRAEPVAERGLARRVDRGRVGDDETRDREDEDAEGVQPVVEPDREFPDVDALEGVGAGRGCGGVHGRLLQTVGDVSTSCSFTPLSS